MRPTFAAEGLRRNLTQYLATSFGLADDTAAAALVRFLNHPEQGIFRGPYVRIRTGFTEADGDWRQHLEWAPPDRDGRPWRPYVHQARAFARLSTKHGPARPTLITTGTGSGKTESFLVPILDHCRRAVAAGQQGIKAILLYPMNALAADQTQRLADFLTDPALADVTAGLYIGDKAGVEYPRVMTSPVLMRVSAPDILITNYKMLDVLLQRAEDQPLWTETALAYIVLDEFHTYDGAQGSDVAMLLRRLGAATGNAKPGMPLGSICPVATSATLGASGGTGGGTEGEALRSVAEDVFGVTFDVDAVIGETRATVADALDEIDHGLPLPDPATLAALPDPARDEDAMAGIARAVLGSDSLDPTELGRGLRRHTLTKAVLDALGGQPRTLPEVLELLPRTGASEWGQGFQVDPEQAVTALTRFIALLSMARDPDRPDRPLLTVEAHLWVRVVSRLLRAVTPVPAFWWDGEPVRDPDPLGLDTDTSLADRRHLLLPSVYCRQCGRSGWAAISRESDPADLVVDADKIYRASGGQDRRRLRYFIAAHAAELDRPDGVLVLVPATRRVRPYDPSRDIVDSTDAVPVLGDLGDSPRGPGRAVPGVPD